MDGKRKKKPDTSSFKTYISRVLKQVHPKITITKSSMSHATNAQKKKAGSSRRKMMKTEINTR